MYLAEHTIKGRRRYIIRDSQFNSEINCWQSRDLFDLGRAPWEYIQYPGGNAFYIDAIVGENLDRKGVDHDPCELEELLWRFIRKEIRLKLEPFYCRPMRGTRKAGRKMDPAGEQVQVFDRRRMYYLRCGAAEQGRIERMPLRYFSALLQKSRDEIEQHFLQLEKSLNPREYKQYVYVIFDLQRHFAGSTARNIPQALDQDELDRHFTGDLCRLHGDESFWAGFHKQEGLHEYLARYAVMFFDYEFDGGSAWHEYLQNFINSKRFYRPPPPQSKVVMAEVVEIFGVGEEELKAMDKNELTKLFRQKAHALHPDKGGEHEMFVKLAEAYKQLLRRKE